MTFDIAFILQQLPVIIDGMLLSLLISVLAIVLGFFGGLLGALIRARKIPVIARLFTIYVEVVRNTPFPVQLFFIYFGLPNIGITIPDLACGLVGLTMIGIAYSSEVFRAGFSSVPVPVVVAARALAMPPAQIFRFVELPIAMRSIVRPLVGTAIILFKESSVLYLISIHEFLYTTVNLATVYFRSTEMIAAMGIFYLGGGLAIGRLGALVERRFNISQTV